MLIRSFARSDTEPVVTLWERCGLTRPWNDPHKDIDRKLTVQPELFLVGVIDGAIVASVMAGYDGHRGWVNYLAVDPDHQRAGLAAALMAVVEADLKRSAARRSRSRCGPATPPPSTSTPRSATPPTGPSYWASG